MPKAISDTDILSEIIEAKDQTVLKNANVYLDQEGHLTFTSVSVYEVLYGLGAKGATRQIQDFTDAMTDHEEITPSRKDFRVAAVIRSRLHIAGRQIGGLDPLIAACALTRRLPLITGNMRHYSYIHSAGFALQLLNWRVAS